MISSLSLLECARSHETVAGKISSLFIQNSLRLFLALAIYKIKTRKRCFRIFIKHVSFFTAHFLASVYVLSFMVLVCQYNAKGGVVMVMHKVFIVNFKHISQPVLVFLLFVSFGHGCLQSRARYMEQSNEIEQNSTRTEKFRMYFCIIFDRYYRYCIFKIKTGH